ncbi:MAG: hypothetical protein ACRCS6_01150 [Turicibacter sp.]
MKIMLILMLSIAILGCSNNKYLKSEDVHRSQVYFNISKKDGLIGLSSIKEFESFVVNNYMEDNRTFFHIEYDLNSCGKIDLLENVFKANHIPPRNYNFKILSETYTTTQNEDDSKQGENVSLCAKVKAIKLNFESVNCGRFSFKERDEYRFNCLIDYTRKISFSSYAWSLDSNDFRTRKYF